MTLSVADISADLAVRIESLAEHLFPAGHRDGLEWRVGSIAGEEGDSLAIHVGGGDKRGTWRDFSLDHGEPGSGGDALDLVQAALNLPSVADAIKWAKDWLGVPDDGPPGRRRRKDAARRPPPAPRAPTEEELRKTGIALGAWKQTQKASGTLVETYLRSRGITIPIPPAIRFSPKLKHTSAGSWHPAMVCSITDASGTVSSVHRTYLAADGRGKAFKKGAGIDSKMCLGPLYSNAIALADPGRVLGIGEGIETCLSVMQAIPGLPVWCAVSANRLGNVALPEVVEHVVILADGDAPGQRAADSARKRLCRQGLRVTIVTPPDGHDFNDLLQAGTLAEAIAPLKEIFA